MKGSARARRPPVWWGRALLVLVVCATVLGALAGCGAQPAGKSVDTAATATAEAQATQAAEPVVVTASVRQEGTVAANNVALVMEAQVRNQSPDTIYLALHVCQRSLIHVELYDGPFLEWFNWEQIPCPRPSTSSCPPTTTENGIDAGISAEQLVASGATYSWSMRGDFNNYPPYVAPQAGKTYTVQTSIYWVSKACVPQATPTSPVPLHTITVTGAITLQ